MKSAHTFEDLSQVSGFELFQNYPDPFSFETTIWFALSEKEHVRIEVYDAIGRSIKTITDQEYNSGYHKVVFENEGLSEGNYFYRIQAGSFHDVKQMIVFDN